MDRVLQRAQVGLEGAAARGTAVPATRKVRGNATFNLNVNRQAVEEVSQGRGSYFGNYRHVTTTKEAAGTISDVVSFDDLHFWLLHGVKNVSSTQPDAVGAPTVRDWEFIPSATTDDARSATYEWFDGADWWQIPYGMMQSFSLSGAANEPVRFSGTVIGKDKIRMAGGGTTGLPDLLTAELAQAENMQFFLDSGASAIGTTPLDAMLIEFELTWGNSISPRRFATGGKTYQTTGKGKRELGLRLTLDYPDRTQYERFVNGDDLKVRMVLPGSNIAGAFNKEIVIDVYGPWNGFDMGDRDNSVIATHTLLPTYDATVASDVRLLVRNTQAAA